MLGVNVSGRDDLNYIAEIESRNLFQFSPDQFSWILLKAISGIGADPVLGLRISGLTVILFSVWVVMRRSTGPYALTLFIISVLPLYLALYFNQVRFALAIAIYVFLLSTRFARAAPAGAALSHVSLALLFFPPAIILAPFVLAAIELLDPLSIASVKFQAYSSPEGLIKPWYFGWELIGLSGILIYYNRLWPSLGLILIVISSRMLADLLSVDVARRLVELSLFAYSPISLYIKEKKLPGKLLIVFFLVLGVLQTAISFSNGVIEIGR